MSGFKMDDYVDVAERIRIFRDKHKGGSLQSEITFADDGSWVLCKAWAYRTDTDPRPGIGHSRLTIPGKTPYTRDSEVENAETSAWGRAIVAALAADTKKIASAQEVAARHNSGVGAAESPSSAAPTPETLEAELLRLTGEWAGPEKAIMAISTAQTAINKNREQNAGDYAAHEEWLRRSIATVRENIAGKESQFKAPTGKPGAKKDAA